jgi:phytoene dehydrogenase-like protein
MSETAVMTPYTFKDRKRNLNTRILESLDALVELAPATARADAETHRAIVHEGVEHYDTLVEELVKVRPDAVAMAASLAGSQEAERPTRPEICGRCLKILTSTPAQLARYIEMATPSAAWSGWPRELFVAKMSAALKVGDEIMFVQAGAVAVRRADGSSFVVYARES